MADRSCAAIIRDGNILMMRQMYRGEELWTLPGGKIEPGETAAECAARETLEETGIEIEVSELVCTFYNERINGQYYCYIGTIVGGELALGKDPELAADSQELLELAWRPLSSMTSHAEGKRVIDFLQAKEERQNEEQEERSCLGCRLANGEEPTHIVYENELLACILDIAPLNEGHLLIMPKRHYHDVDELDPAIAGEIMKVSAVMARLLKTQFKSDGITIMQNGGVFNDLSHYHMHVFPRYKGDGFGWLEPEDTANAKDRLAETKEKLAAAINGL